MKSPQLALRTFCRSCRVKRKYFPTFSHLNVKIIPIENEYYQKITKKFS